MNDPYAAAGLIIWAAVAVIIVVLVAVFALTLGIVK